MDFSVYIHLPFCRVQCPYCTFYTVLRPNHDAAMQPLLDAVRREWTLRVAPRLQRGDRLATLYLGGGTPSDLPAAALAAFLGALGDDLPGGLAALDEATVECNPESATPELLDTLRTAGIGRASLGVQAMDATDLERLGRASTVAQNRAALAAVGARFPTWNADLILGIPGTTVERLDAGLAALVEAGAPHLSLYCLELPPERARRLGDPQDADSQARAADLYLHAAARIAAQGYVHYEISNAARPGHEARHNAGYWNGREYVGLGPGAHSLEQGRRRWNRGDAAAYVAALAGGGAAPGRSERRTAARRAHEAVFLGLRQRTGVDIASLPVPPPDGWLARLEDTGLARREAGRLRLTPKGWLVSDSIVLQLLGNETADSGPR